MHCIVIDTTPARVESAKASVAAAGGLCRPTLAPVVLAANTADMGAYAVKDPESSSRQPSDVSVKLGSAQADTTMVNAVWELVSYQAELLSGNWLYAVLAVLLSSLIFVYCRRARIKGRLPVLCSCM